jgi:polyribonucleotide nucleotidyltransferase
LFSATQKFDLQLADRQLTIEVGKEVDRFSNGACIVSYGETIVMVNVVAAKKPKEGINFFPLSVDFEERLYAVGKIPGSFFKREGKPLESAILASRLIDRGIRPLFPHRLRNEVAVTVTVLSVDPDCSPEVAGIIGSSAALAASDIPWGGPIAGVTLGYANGKVIINPTQQQRETSKMMTTISGSAEKIVMIESGAYEITEKVMLEAIKEGHREIKRIVSLINQIVEKVGKKKFPVPALCAAATEEMKNTLKNLRAHAEPLLKAALDEPDKLIRDRNVDAAQEAIKEQFDSCYETHAPLIDECLYCLQKEIVRSWLIEGKRVDGRSQEEMRPLAAAVSLLPRAHGSGLFSRGRTQILTAATLGMAREAQVLDGFDDEDSKKYIHHYNFPSYSVGETRPGRGPGRREIGHGALAEKALLPVIPSIEEFPYTIRLVSEILSSNGSTSQGAICGSTLALMDAGVPIKSPVAGISCGLISHPEGRTIFLDIQGIEDFFGDMDFKVAGTKEGITAIQLDIKTDGLSYDIIEEVLEKTKEARCKILDEVMLLAIPEARSELSKYVPRIQIIRIDPSKIREIIGPGGRVVQKLTADFDVTIDIEEDGTIFVASLDAENAKKAIKQIEFIVQEPEIGQIYNGRVVKLMPFGAFVEILPGKDGLLHISRFSRERVEKIEDVTRVGEEIRVKLIAIDEQGKLVLSKKDAT